VQHSGEQMVRMKAMYRKAALGLTQSYRSITPRQKECKNLLVPVCLSASHIAYVLFAWSPVFMVLAQAAATAAAMAIQTKADVQEINVQQRNRR